MSTTRRDPRAGWVHEIDKPPRGPGGRPLCRECQEEVPRGRRTFCSVKCVDRWKFRTNPGYVRAKVKARDKGICASCRIDTKDVKNALQVLKDLAVPWSGLRDRMPHVWKLREDLMRSLKVSHRRSLWDADHIVPVVTGGGGCGLENYQTLCVWCHRVKSAQARKKR